MENDDSKEVAPQTSEPLGFSMPVEDEVRGILGRYVDYNNPQVLVIKDNQVIINRTQVSSTHIFIIEEELKHTGFTVRVVDHHPASPETV